MSNKAPRSPRATMRDVAALAGVSLKTVSRVVNREGGVSPEVVARVEKAVAQLGYRPNLAASNLRRINSRSAMIGALLQDVSNSFSASLLRSLEDAARERDMVIIAASLDEEADRERDAGRGPGAAPRGRPPAHAGDRPPGLPVRRAAQRSAGRLRGPSAQRGRRRLGHRRQRPGLPACGRAPGGPRPPAHRDARRPAHDPDGIRARPWLPGGRGQRGHRGDAGVAEMSLRSSEDAMAAVVACSTLPTPRPHSSRRATHWR